MDKDSVISEQNQLLSLLERETRAQRETIAELIQEIATIRFESTQTVPMRIPCPVCHKLHIDEGSFSTKPHHTYACQFCGNVWRPAIVPTVGVQFLPGFKNEDAE